MLSVEMLLIYGRQYRRCYFVERTWYKLCGSVGRKMEGDRQLLFNQSDNLTQQQTEREYFDSSLPGMTYSEYQESSMKNWNHRFNMKLDYQISNRTSLQFRPTLNFQNNDSHGLLQGLNLLNGMSDNETETATLGEMMLTMLELTLSCVIVS